MTHLEAETSGLLAFEGSVLAINQDWYVRSQTLNIKYGGGRKESFVGWKDGTGSTSHTTL